MLNVKILKILTMFIRHLIP